MSRKINRDYLLANLSVVNTLLAELTPKDVLSRISLESEKADIQEELDQLDNTPENLASVALMFGGDPVVGSMGIDAKFAAQAMSNYQDVITKIAVTKNSNELLKSTGPVPSESMSHLHITHLIHGSFGFQLEELSENSQLFETPLMEAAKQAMHITMLAAGDNDEEFLDAISEYNPRVVISLREFLLTIKKNNATMRLVTGNMDRDFQKEDILSALERVESTQNDENTQDIPGKFLGVLIESRRFEFKRSDSVETLRGRVVSDLTDSDLGHMSNQFLDKSCIGKFRVTSITRAGKRIVRYTLINLNEWKNIE